MSRITNGCIKVVFIPFNLMKGSTCMHFHKSTSYNLPYIFHIYKLVHLHFLFLVKVYIRQIEQPSASGYHHLDLKTPDINLLLHFIILIKKSPLYFVCSIERVSACFPDKLVLQYSIIAGTHLFVQQSMTALKSPVPSRMRSTSCSSYQKKKEYTNEIVRSQSVSFC